MIKHQRLWFTLVAVALLSACTTKQTVITAPTVIIPPDFSNLSTKSCKNGEVINTPATLKLNKEGKVVSVSGLKIKDKQLIRQIREQFKKAKYTPYLQHGEPIERPLEVAISLTCPKRT